MRQLFAYWPEAVRAGLTVVVLWGVPVGAPLGSLLIVLCLIWFWNR